MSLSSISDFLNFTFATVRTVNKGRTASLGQILVEIAHTVAKMCQFTICQDGGRRHLGFVMRVLRPPTKGI